MSIVQGPNNQSLPSCSASPRPGGAYVVFAVGRHDCRTTLGSGTITEGVKDALTDDRGLPSDPLLSLRGSREGLLANREPRGKKMDDDRQRRKRRDGMGSRIKHGCFQRSRWADRCADGNHLREIVWDANCTNLVILIAGPGSYSRYPSLDRCCSHLNSIAHYLPLRAWLPKG